MAPSADPHSPTTPFELSIHLSQSGTEQTKAGLVVRSSDTVSRWSRGAWGPALPYHLGDGVSGSRCGGCGLEDSVERTEEASPVREKKPVEAGLDGVPNHSELEPNGGVPHRLGGAQKTGGVTRHSARTTTSYGSKTSIMARSQATTARAYASVKTR
jgi:hypothetical protein